MHCRVVVGNGVPLASHWGPHRGLGRATFVSHVWNISLFVSLSMCLYAYICIDVSAFVCMCTCNNHPM